MSEQRTKDNRKHTPEVAIIQNKHRQEVREVKANPLSMWVPHLGPKDGIRV